MLEGGKCCEENRAGLGIPGMCLCWGRAVGWGEKAGIVQDAY